MRNTKQRIAILSTLLLVVGLSLQTATAQTFRGGISGVVTDQSGAAIPGAAVEATNDATGVVHDTVSSSAGEFAFQEFPLGTYTITVTASGFQTTKVDKVPVTAGYIYSLPIKLALSQQAVTIEINAAALALDTTSTTQTAGVQGNNLQDTPLNGRDFTQLMILAPGFANSGAGGYGSLNGTRANQINWQIDGIDNNDLWHNIPAVNQGGVSGIAGIILPIDAVQEFSVQTQAAPESGRNPGGSVNLSLKSGTNGLHGTAYYYNRNEAFGATNPIQLESGTPKQVVRNYNFGYSAGGPVIKDKLFWFTTFEKQRFKIGVPALATEPSTGWQAAAANAIDAANTAAGFTKYTINPVATNLLKTLWPSKVTGALKGDTASSGAVNDYSDNDPEFGYSYNGLAVIDWTINEKNTLKAHWFAGQGNQVAPVGSNLLYYYEVAPIHVQNYAIVFNHVFTPTITNQLLAGVNYFNQVFNDYNTGFDVASLGLVTGSTLPGAPTINIGQFDQVGATPPEGRNDITGHLTDDFSWVIGKHQIKLGGELRKAQLDEFYHRHALGSFVFDGSQGPYGSARGDNSNPNDTWGTGDTGNAYTNALTDFLTGQYYSAYVALGDPDRQVFVTTYDLFAQDAFQVTSKLNVNYGLRWDYEGPLHNQWKNLSVFRPDLANLATPGIAYQGADISNLYDPKYTNFSPRAGVSYQLLPKTVLRAGLGLYYDTPNLNPFLDNRPGNGAPNGVEGNPGGGDPVVNATASSGTITPFVNLFSGVSASNSIFSIQQNFQPSHNLNYNIQVEQALSDKVIAQVGYVGSGGRHLLSIRDINQLDIDGNGSRPYATQFPQYSFINEIQSIGTSNYNSLQATLRVSNWHNLDAQGAYTWSHSNDIVTAYRGALPQDSFNFKGDYGASDFDERNIFTAFASYHIPGGENLKPLTNGWQVNTLATFHSGFPITVLSGSDTSGTGEGTQRAELTGQNPYLNAKINKAGALWLNPGAFTNPALGTFGNSVRNGFSGPGLSDVDLSVFKNTPITERVSTQFRVEMFNVFNRYNFGSPGGVNPNNASPSNLFLTTTIGNWNGAPGIGAGEPFNTQLALKIIF